MLREEKKTSVKATNFNIFLEDKGEMKINLY